MTTATSAVTTAVVAPGVASLAERAASVLGVLQCTARNEPPSSFENPTNTTFAARGSTSNEQLSGQWAAAAVLRLTLMFAMETVLRVLVSGVIYVSGTDAEQVALSRVLSGRSWLALVARVPGCFVVASQTAIFGAVEASSHALSAAAAPLAIAIAVVTYLVAAAVAFAIVHRTPPDAPRFLAQVIPSPPPSRTEAAIAPSSSSCAVAALALRWLMQGDDEWVASNDDVTTDEGRESVMFHCCHDVMYEAYVEERRWFLAVEFAAGVASAVVSGIRSPLWAVCLLTRIALLVTCIVSLAMLVCLRPFRRRVDTVQNAVIGVTTLLAAVLATAGQDHAAEVTTNLSMALVVVRVALEVILVVYGKLPTVRAALKEARRRMQETVNNALLPDAATRRGANWKAPSLVTSGMPHPMAAVEVSLLEIPPTLTPSPPAIHRGPPPPSTEPGPRAHALARSCDAHCPPRDPPGDTQCPLRDPPLEALFASVALQRQPIVNPINCLRASASQRVDHGGDDDGEALANLLSSTAREEDSLAAFLGCL